jgi:hypothetical protein
MKSYKLLVVLALSAVSGATFASSFPSDAEASYDLPALESRADRMARSGEADQNWGVSQRQSQDVFPSHGGNTDD